MRQYQLRTRESTNLHEAQWNSLNTHWADGSDSEYILFNELLTASACRSIGFSVLNPIGKIDVAHLYHLLRD